MKHYDTKSLRLKFHVNDKVSFEFSKQVLSGMIARLNPKRAHIIGEDGQEYQIPYEMLTLLAKNQKNLEKSRGRLELEAIKRLALKFMTKHNLHDWSFEFDNGSTRAGCCKYGKKLITLSHEYARYTSIKDIKNTILHEIAHALVGAKHHHDAVWKAKAIEIGCSGERCHDIQFTPPRYLVKCKNNCWVAAAERRRRNTVCKHCNGEIIYLTYTDERWDREAKQRI